LLTAKSGQTGHSKIYSKIEQNFNRANLINRAQQNQQNNPHTEIFPPKAGNFSGLVPLKGKINENSKVPRFF